MKRILVVLSFLAVVGAIAALNLTNNACPRFALYPVAAATKKCYHNPDVLSNFESIVSRHNYTSRTYSVTTDDGYTLTIFRISSPTIAPTRCPVFILHGLTESAAFFINRGNESLGFNLVEKGYDVWLGNVRGTTYSNKHVNLTVNNPEYWNYNLDRLAEMDLPPQLKLVANKTGNLGNILYVGHSMGHTLISMYCSNSYDEVSHLIQGIIGLAPAVYMKNSPFYIILWPVFQLALSLGFKGLFYQEQFFHELFVGFCRLAPAICIAFVDFVVGITNQMAPEFLLVLFSYFPTGTSIYQFLHYAQWTLSGRFQKYDYGPTGNLQAYDDVQPPTYDLSVIKMPVHLYYGLKDGLVRPENVPRLYNELGSTQKFLHKIPAVDDFYAFNHFDFFYSEFIWKFFYSDLFSVLDNFYNH